MLESSRMTPCSTLLMYSENADRVGGGACREELMRDMRCVEARMDGLGLGADMENRSVANAD